MKKNEDQIELVIEIIEEILVQVHERRNYLDDLFLKISMTSDIEIAELYKNELKAIQNKLLSFSNDLKQPILNSIIKYKSYYNSNISNYDSNSSPDKYGSDDFLRAWIKGFLKDFALENASYLFSDILNLDPIGLKETDPDWIENIEDYIDYPHFKELIDAITAIIHFQYLFQVCNKSEDKVGFINNKRKRTNIKTIQLTTCLTESQAKKLYILLIDRKLIPDTTCRDGFISAFGNKENNFIIHWNGSKSLLAYFVDVFNCEILGNDGVKSRTQWKPFEILFNVSGLRGSKNDYQKTGSLPVGHQQIDTIINAILICK